MQKWHEKVLHIASNAGDEVQQTSLPEFLEEMLGDIAFVAYDPALQRGCHGVEGFAIIRFAAVILTAMTSPLLLMTMCSLKPKNQPMVLRPRLARPLKTLFRLIRLLWQTASFVESTAQVPRISCSSVPGFCNPEAFDDDAVRSPS